MSVPLVNSTSLRAAGVHLCKGVGGFGPRRYVEKPGDVTTAFCSIAYWWGQGPSGFYLLFPVRCVVYEC